MQNTLTADKQIRTSSGLWVDVFEPKPEQIIIEDIAHALSQQPRFGGHLPHFYSVAQHSIMCAAIVPEKYRLAALLHDASEAYLLDIPRPIKRHLINYKEIEDRLMVVIAKKFGFQWPMPKEVKEADEYMLAREWEELMIAGDKASVSKSMNITKKNFIQKFNEYSTI